MSNLTHGDFEVLDANDPLAPSRDKFVIAEDEIYLDGNSLGLLPKAAIERTREVITQEWGQGLIRSWNKADWVNAPRRIGDKIATFVGANPGEVICADSTSANLFKLAAAAVKMQPGRHKIISEPGNFPTDLYILQGLVQYLGSDYTLAVIERDKIPDAIDEDTAAVVLTQVHYKTGLMFDMKAITKRAHDKGALALWDLSHSAGALAVDLNGCNADMAVGCGYKYLNGGPGAPAFLFVAKRHQDKIQTPLTGWFGHEAPFVFDDDYRPASGIERTQCGTPAVIGLSVLEVGVDIMAQADMSDIRRKSSKMGDLFIQLLDEKCKDYGFEIVSPRDANVRGSQVSMKHDNGYAIVQALIARGVIGDFRAPDIMRFGFTPLYLRYIDIWNMVEILVEIMETNEWQKPEYSKVAAVT